MFCIFWMCIVAKKGNFYNFVRGSCCKFHTFWLFKHELNMKSNIISLIDILDAEKIHKSVSMPWALFKTPLIVDVKSIPVSRKSGDQWAYVITPFVPLRGLDGRDHLRGLFTFLWTRGLKIQEYAQMLKLE